MERAQAQRREDRAFSTVQFRDRSRRGGAIRLPPIDLRSVRGEKFRYPDEMGGLCPWLRDSIGGMLHVLEWAGTLPWTYAGTPYEKQIDPEGITTEFVRCPDPTAAGIVVKITRTRLPEEG